MNPHLLRNIPEYSKLPLNCIVDYEKKTPLHYLREAWISNDSLEEKNISLYQINKIFHYILDFLEAHRSNHYTYFETMKSLTTISMFILTYASPDLVSKFLRSSIYNQPHLHSIGSTSQKIIQIDLPLLRDQDIDLIYKKEGTEWVKFKILGYSMDFDSLSEESLELIRSLKKITNQEYFKTKAISVMIDHFWNQNFSLIGFQAFLFTCLIVLISINFGLDHKEFGIQIIILILVTIFVLYEILQMWSMKSSYFKDFWNYIDLSFYAMAITGIVAQLAELDDYIKLGWIYTSALFTGYGRWITYLRLFDLSSNIFSIYNS